MSSLVRICTTSTDLVRSSAWNRYDKCSVTFSQESKYITICVFQRCGHFVICIQKVDLHYNEQSTMNVLDSCQFEVGNVNFILRSGEWFDSNIWINLTTISRYNSRPYRTTPAHPNTAKTLFSFYYIYTFSNQPTQCSNPQEKRAHRLCCIACRDNHQLL